MVYYAAPAVAPADPVDVFKRDGITFIWQGWDGSEWELSSRASGVFLLAGVRGLHMPPGTRHRDTSPGAHGSQHRGTQWHEREVFLPVKTWHGGTGPEWMARDSAFWRTMDPDTPGRLIVRRQDAPDRYLELRYEPTTKDEGFEVLPSLRRWAHYGIYLAADQPFWVGKPTVKSWPAGVGTGSITTAGETDAPPTIYMDGPLEAGASIALGGQRVTVPFPVTAWHCLVIDSDPRRVGAVQYLIPDQGLAKPPAERVIGVDLTNPVDRSREIGVMNLPVISPGRSVQVSFSTSGSGRLEIAVPSFHKRAW